MDDLIWCCTFVHVESVTCSLRGLVAGTDILSVSSTDSWLQ